MSLQPVTGDYAFEGSSVLSPGIGGAGLGGAVGVYFGIGRFTSALEFSTARISREQNGGSYIRGRFNPEGVLQDRLLNILVGYVLPTSGADLRIVAGASRNSGSPRLAGFAIDGPQSFDGQAHWGSTFGLDTSRELGRRLALLANARYSVLQRRREAVEYGVGPHVLRVGVGVTLLLID